MCSVVEIRQEWYTYTVYPRFVTDQLSTFAHSRDSRDSVSKFWTFSFILFFWKGKYVQSRQNALLIFKGAVSQDLGVVLRGSIDRCEHFCLTIPSEYYCHKKNLKNNLHCNIQYFIHAVFSADSTLQRPVLAVLYVQYSTGLTFASWNYSRLHNLTRYLFKCSNGTLLERTKIWNHGSK